MIVIYTDGSSRGNGSQYSIGGFGVVVCQGPTEDALRCIDAYSIQEKGVTNNQMELRAILWAIEKYGAQAFSFEIPTIYTDSMYCLNSFTQWLDGWKRNGWTRAGNKPLENKELMQRYDKLVNQDGRGVKLEYVRGHAGNMWNELADRLATGKILPREVMERYG